MQPSRNMMLTFDPVPWVAVVSVAGNLDLVIGVQ